MLQQLHREQLVQVRGGKVSLLNLAPSIEA